jgi:hypothetical protein
LRMSIAACFAFEWPFAISFLFFASSFAVSSTGKGSMVDGASGIAGDVGSGRLTVDGKVKVDAVGSDGAAKMGAGVDEEGFVVVMTGRMQCQQEWIFQLIPI